MWISLALALVIVNLQPPFSYATRHLHPTLAGSSEIAVLKLLLLISIHKWMVLYKQLPSSDPSDMRVLVSKTYFDVKTLTEFDFDHDTSHVDL